MMETKVTQNGYVYVYLSNESGEPVYFDNFEVHHQRGQLLEEGNYYAYGLKITSISAKAANSSLNPSFTKQGYQGAYADELSEFELNYNEFELRTYDPQIGRWTTTDPYNEFASPYLGMGCDPVNMTDPNGGSVLGNAALGAFMGAWAGAAITALTGGDGEDGMLIGAIAGALVGAGLSFTAAPAATQLEIIKSIKSAVPIVVNTAVSVAGNEVANKTKGFIVALVGENRDATSNMSAKRLKALEENLEKGRVILRESDELTPELAIDIKKALGEEGYIDKMILDYHRSDYDDMEEKENFYKELKDVVSSKTTVLAGMCWAGGGVSILNKKTGEINEHLNITKLISPSLNNATVYGLKTEASNLPFLIGGNFGTYSPDFIFSGKISKWERKYRSTWAITSYDPVTKQIKTIAVKARIRLTREGFFQIKIKKYVYNAKNM